MSTLAQGLDPNLPCSNIIVYNDYQSHIIRKFKCETCSKVLFELVHSVGNDADFVFPLKVVCKETVHLLIEREQPKENANMTAEGQKCVRSTAIAHLRKFL